MLELPQPVLSSDDLSKLVSGNLDGFPVRVLPALFEAGAADAGASLERALATLCASADRAVDEGVSILVVSDRDVDAGHAPIPSLLATSAVHHALARAGKRMRVGLIVETGEAREVADVALLLGYGAAAVSPYLAFETIEALDLDTPREGRAKRYTDALDKGLLKVMSKMGISCLSSYQGAQIFEAIGLGQAVVDRWFPGTASRIGGIGLAEIAHEACLRHAAGYREAIDVTGEDEGVLDVGGAYAWRVGGERHLWSPKTVASLQRAVRLQDAKSYDDYARAINDQDDLPFTLRGCWELRAAEAPLPLDEVEPATKIVRRFATGAMSFGSISKEAHENLAIAMNRIGGRSNSGEGGEDEARFVVLPNGDSRRSAIKQVASARFGVTAHYLVNADELQIKIAQGAKPGEGGQLPGHKVDEAIARVRHSVPGVTLISPPPHHDIYSIEDLAQLIFDLKCVNDRARVSVKLVSEAGVGTIAAGVAKAHADAIHIAGHDGGTGASPLSSIQHAGAPWELGLAETHQVLSLNGLRGRVRLQVDGQLKTGRDVAFAALLGADEFGFATAPLVASGCVMMRKCHLNTCPVGIATQDPVLRARFQGTPEHVINYLFFVAEELAPSWPRWASAASKRWSAASIASAFARWSTRRLARSTSATCCAPRSGPHATTPAPCSTACSPTPQIRPCSRGPASASSTASPRRCRSTSRTPTAPSGRSSPARSPASTGKPGCPTGPWSSRPLAPRARASVPSRRAACSSCSRATRTTLWARDSPAGCSRCGRRPARDIAARTASSSATRASTAPRRAGSSSPARRASASPFATAAPLQSSRAWALTLAST